MNAPIAISNKSSHTRKIQGDDESANTALLFKKCSEIISKLHQTTNIMKLLEKKIKKDKFLSKLHQQSC